MMKQLRKHYHLDYYNTFHSKNYVFVVLKANVCISLKDEVLIANLLVTNYTILIKWNSLS